MALKEAGAPTHSLLLVSRLSAGVSDGLSPPFKPTMCDFQVPLKPPHRAFHSKLTNFRIDGKSSQPFLRQGLNID